MKGESDLRPSSDAVLLESDRVYTNIPFTGSTETIREAEK